MRKELHPTQKKLVELLSNHIDDPLTYRELQYRLDISSTSVVSHHLKQLEKKGYLKRNSSNPQDYHILIDGPEKQVAYLNLYGLAHCGPKGNFLDRNPIDRIPIPTRLLSFPSFEGFLVEAKGNSMTPKISEGDIVIARKKGTVDNGKIVICINEGEALVKKIEMGNDKIILVSTNPEHSPFLAGDDFRIVGEVMGVFSYNLD